MHKKGRGNESSAAADISDHSHPHPQLHAPFPRLTIITLPTLPPSRPQPLRRPPTDVAASPAVPDVAAELPEVPAPPATDRKGPGKRKKSLAVKKLAAIQEKFDFLSQNLYPVPFAPCRAPGLGRDEQLFRILGLWDFAHLNLAADPLRSDFLAELITHYTLSSRSSKVCEVRVRISRADLARALALPVKKTFTPTDDELTLFTTEEATTVLTSFIQNWIVIMEDACVVPREVVTATMKEGHAYKVDWAGLVWMMVEKELQEATKSEQCLYASHLQRLIKHQRPELFEAEAFEEPLYKDVEGGGGLVLSTGEIQRLEQLKKVEEMSRAAEVKRLEEEEERRRPEEMITEFAKGWNMKFTEYDQLIANLATKFTKHKENFLLIKESYASAKLSEAKAEED